MSSMFEMSVQCTYCNIIYIYYIYIKVNTHNLNHFINISYRRMQIFVLFYNIRKFTMTLYAVYKYTHPSLHLLIIISIQYFFE